MRYLPQNPYIYLLARLLFSVEKDTSIISVNRTKLVSE